MRFPSANIIPGLKEERPLADEIRIQTVAFVVCEELKVKLKDITGKTRKRPAVVARFTAISIIREYGITLQSIGNYFNRDHTSVIHACKEVGNMLEVDEEYKKLYDGLKIKIRLSGV
jgi:chromosomal replication initiator protein